MPPNAEIIVLGNLFSLTPGTFVPDVSPGRRARRFHALYSDGEALLADLG